MAGPGNNGGDGVCVLRTRLSGQLLLLGCRDQLKGDAAAAAEHGTRWKPRPQRSPARDVVDALFGAGLDRPVEDRHGQ